MATSPFLFTNTYQAYKKRTANIATFLHQTVAKIGYKTTKPLNTKKAIPDQSQKPLLRIPQFIEYAKAIRMKAPPLVVIPQSILADLEETLNLRRQVTTFYESMAYNALGGEAGTGINRYKADSKVMRGHHYFIKILERVLELLQPVATDVDNKPSELKKDHSQSSGKRLHSDVVHVTNRFNVLIVEEPEEFHGQEAPELDGTAKHEEEDDFEMELQLAAFCLFKDIGIIKTYIQEVWNKYKNSREDGTDLMTASLVTNTAIDLVKRMDEEFRNNFPEVKNYSDMVAHAVFPVAIARFQEEGQAEITFREWSSQRKWWKDYQASSESDWLLLPTWRILEYFMSLCRLGSMVPYQRCEGEDGTEIGVWPWDEIRDKRRPLLDSLADFHTRGITTAATKNPLFSIFCIDETTLGMTDRIQTGCAKLWFVFALQVHSDIHDILCDGLSEPFQELRRAALAIKASLNLALQNTDLAERCAKNKDFSDRIGIHEVIAIVDNWVLSDLFHLVTIAQAKDDRSPPPPTEEFSLQKRHPTMAGITLFVITMQARNVGLMLCGIWGTMIAPLHLYNAVFQAGELKVEWPDMERVMQIHEGNRIFCGSRPSTKKACYESFRALIAGQKRNPGFDLLDISPIVDTFHERYTQKQGHLEWTIRKIELVVKASETGKNRNRDRRAENGISVVSLLKALRNLMAIDGPKLRFDYTSLHRRNIRLLKTLREDLREDIALQVECLKLGDNAWSFMYDDISLACIVSWILKYTVVLEKGFKKDRKSTGSYDPRIHSQFYTKAAKIIKDFIDREGNIEIRKIEAV